MAESDQISRKRMRFSSPSVLTRSKSRIRIQNNHAGGTGYAASRAGSGSFADLRQCPSSLSEKLETKLPRGYPRVPIKDLRLRRVSSQASVTNDWDFRRNGEDQTEEQQKDSLCGSQDLNVFKDGSKAIHGLGALMDDPGEECLQTTPPDAGIFRSQPVVAEHGAHRVDQEINGSQGNGFSESAEKKNDNYLRSKPVLNRCSRAKLFKTPGSFSYRRLLPYLLEVADDAASAGQSLKSEKPFGEVHRSLNLHGEEVNGKSGNADIENLKAEGEFMVVKDQSTETKHVLQSADTVYSACNSPLNKRIENSPNRKSVQEQGFRRKLFRTPGSVNYRRLLPYFTDIQEDNPCVVGIGNHSESIRDSTLSISSVPDDEEAPEKITSTVVGDTHRNRDPVSEACEQVSEIPELIDPEKEQETQVKHVIQDSQKNIVASHEVLGLEMPLSSLASSRCSSDFATSFPDNSSVGTLFEQIKSNIETRTTEENTEVENNEEEREANCLNTKVLLETRTSEENAEVENNAEEREANGLNTKVSLLEASVSVGTPPSNSPLKSILKRNAQGCRGLCTCFNCSSFRLHAERAFEFSRNQMQETEEMVLDLVREISCLRGMLAKSAPANHTVLCTNQMKDACRRASEAADLAKKRLHQMNDDLQVQCRIPAEQRARVKFAHYIQEKAILRQYEPDK